jgi:hypothetical protein
MEKMLEQILKNQELVFNELKNIKSNVKELKVKVDNIEQKTEVIYTQTGKLTEYNTVTNNRIDDLAALTSQNCLEIARLKADQ